MAILIALTLPACESGPRVRMAPGYEATDTPVQSSANVLGTPAPTRIPPTPTIAPLAMDEMTFTQHQRLAQPLTANDRSALTALQADAGLRDCANIIGLLLAADRKLEQEAVEPQCVIEALK